MSASLFYVNLRHFGVTKSVQGISAQYKQHRSESAQVEISPEENELSLL